jgi:O-Antigen ligase
MGVPGSTALRARAASAPAVVRVQQHTDSYRMARALILVLLAAAVDVSNYLDTGGWPRYLILLVPLGALALIRLQNPSALIRRPSGTDRILLLLLLVGLPGTLYGILFRGTSATALPVFVPMVIAFLYLGTLEEPTNREVRGILRAIEWVGIIYIVLHAAVSSELLAELADFRQFRNASLLFVALGVGAAVALRHWARALLVLVLWGAAFAAYPSGTSVLVALTVAFTLLMTPVRPTRLRPYLVAGAGAAVVVILVLNFSTGIRLSSDYFSLVGKSDNNSSRLAVWTAGMERFEESPLYGEVFSGPGVTTAVRELGGRRFQLPYHNDYIHFLANGGLIGFGLLMGWIVFTELTVLRRLTTFTAAGDRSRASLLRTLLVGFNAFFVTAAFNPTLMGVSRAASIFSIYALIMMTVQVPRREASP